MTLNDYLRVLRERWIVMFTIVVLALGSAAGIWFLRPPEYTAALTMYVSAQTADTTSTAYQGAQLSEQRVKSYVELVDSPRVCRGGRREPAAWPSPRTTWRNGSPPRVRSSRC